MTEDQSGKWISTQQAAVLIGISRQAVWKAIKRGDIEAFEVGNSFNVSRESAEAYKAKRTNNKGE